MTFTEAIKTCFSKYADFSGCASRPEFWWWTLFTVLGTLGAQMLNYRLSGVFSLATLLPSFAVGCRRLHDTDRSGWWQLLNLVPLIGWIILLLWWVQEGTPNRYGGPASGGGLASGR